MKISKFIKIQFNQKLDIVMYYRDFPDKFYIILSGKCGVMLPKKVHEIDAMSFQTGKRVNIHQLKKEELQ